MRTHSPQRRDRGAVLPLVLVASVAMSIVVVAVAGYVSTGLRYGNVVEQRADRLAAADGGMRYAVERLKLGASRICSTGNGSVIDPPDINGATVTVSCSQVGLGFDDVTGWALTLTGEGVPFNSAECPGPDGACWLLYTQGGASVQKLVGGPVYMADVTDQGFSLGADVQFRYSQLLYSAADCETSVPDLTDGSKAATFDSTSLGLACTEQPWSKDANPSTGLFSAPIVGPLPAASGATLNPPPTTDLNDCKIFEPGYYNVAPVLGANNYFRSGNYVFDGFTLNVKQAKVTAGRAHGDGDDGAAQFLENNACVSARNGDTNGIINSGVTFYMKNGAKFVLDSHGNLEILRRKQGKSYVSIHVLDGSGTWNQNIIDQGPGTNKDMAVHGLVWAPESRMTFGNVTNTANGQILGGAVLSNVELGSSASAIGFVISVEPSDLTGKLQLDSTAEKDGVTTTIRSIVDYRPSTSYTAVTSWRVVE